MLLEKLTNASGISGSEEEVREVIISLVKDHVDSIEVDHLGNLICYKKGKNPKTDKTLMLAAHMDEVGLMVTGIDNEGLIKFTPVGGIDKRVLVSKAVLLGEEKIPGVIGAKPIHLQTRAESNNPLEIDSLYIDIGASSKEEASSKVDLGDFIVFDTEYEEFGNNKIKAKALDDRVGCGVLVRLLQTVEDTSFYGVFTTMEEVGLRGARVSANKIDPDFALILEGTVCYDMANVDSHLAPTRIGKGPALSLMDRTTIYDKDIRDRVIKIAKKENIPYQFRKSSSGGNDSGPIHTAKEGRKTMTISVPCRYIHSPVSVLDLDDFDNTYKLAYKIIEEFNKGEF